MCPLMGVEPSLLPLVLDKNQVSTEGRGVRWRAVAAWLCLLCLGAAQPQSQLATAAETPRCEISQHKPLFVAFGRGMGLESFEEAALASHAIVRRVKHWACDDPASAYTAIPSLQLALAAQGVSLERVQFDDIGLSQAHVVLAGATAGRGHGRNDGHPRHTGNERRTGSRWRVDLKRGADDISAWSVTRSRRW